MRSDGFTTPKVSPEGIADLGLDRNERHAVHEQDDVRDDAGLHAARRVHTELVDGVEPVAPRVSEVDELNNRVRLARHLVDVDLGLEEQVLHRLVGFEQSVVRLPEDLVAEVVELAIRQPGFALCCEIDGPNRAAENLGENPLAKPGAQALGWIGWNESLALVDDCPAERAELVEERLFYVEVLACEEV